MKNRKEMLSLMVSIIIRFVHSQDMPVIYFLLWKNWKMLSNTRNKSR